MTERELRAVAEAIVTACVVKKLAVQPMPDDIAYELASASIQSSDSKYVKGLVEALNALQDISDVSFVNDQEYNYQQQIINQALETLPEDLRK